MIFKKIINKLFYDYSWYIALGKCSTFQNVRYTEFKLLDMPANHWAADPFLIQYNNDYAVVYEYTNTKKSKSVLALSIINGLSISDPVVIYEFEGHTSYPCSFVFDGTPYIIPETLDDRKIYLLKCIEWPYKWEIISTLIDNLPAVDTTVFPSDNGLKAFVYTIDEKNYNNRDLYVADLDVKHGTLKNKILLASNNNRDGRPGGGNITVDDTVVRVVQPFNKIYGEKIELRSFDSFDEEYSEQLIDSLYPDDIMICNKQNKMVGIHTLNLLGDYAVIDLRGCLKKDLFKPIKYMLKYFGIFGYGLYEKNKKMIGSRNF